MGPTGYVAVGDGRSGGDGDGVVVVVVSVVMMTKMEVEKLAVVMEVVANRATKLLRTFLYTSLGGSVTHSIGHRSRSGTAGSEDKHVFNFSICCQTVFQKTVVFTLLPVTYKFLVLHIPTLSIVCFVH